MILLLRIKQMFLKCFYVNTIKYFHHSVNIVLILGPGCEFCSANFAQFHLTFMGIKLMMEIFPLKQLLLVFKINLIKK